MRGHGDAILPNDLVFDVVLAVLHLREVQRSGHDKNVGMTLCFQSGILLQPIPDIFMNKKHFINEDPEVMGNNEILLQTAHTRLFCPRTSVKPIADLQELIDLNSVTSMKLPKNSWSI